MTAEDPKSSGQVTALVRGLSILRSFSRDSTELSNGDLARLTGLAKSTVSRLTHTLTEQGFLTSGVNNDRYRLGPGVLGLGFQYLAHSGIQQFAAPHMQALANAVGCSIALGVADGDSVMYQYVANCGNPYGLRLTSGDRLPLLQTAMGRVLVAMHAREERPLDVSVDAQPTVERSLADLDRLGACLSLGEWKPEIHAIAVPIYPIPGGPIMALNCGGSSVTLPQVKLEVEILPQLKDTALTIEAMLKSAP
ncbi:IclR family transcriptional regulator [Saccharospirillum salsuginis]|uniref:Transcriptional regulator n=1 Tax=Saccharospirillum salsuginis TaxID=418750 RepID=A0A918JZF4_9GAMM|nr:IclR family transcriptional regulator [Saccharospirillum salsuginis]GGX38928.1 transcriptional regulator [Saccharospirillum salsuginis]